MAPGTLSGLPRFIGMVHLCPLPGSPRFERGTDFGSILAAAERDALALANGGVDALLIENWGDAPFRPSALEPETIAAMARVVGHLAARVQVPLGVNCLRNDARAALGLCATGEASFFRVNVHTGATVTDQGLIEGRAWETLRERVRVAPHAKLMADVQVKHGRSLVERPLVEEAQDTALRGGADALILSGESTGATPTLGDLESVRKALPDVALYVGSGLTLANAEQLLGVATGAIVGTSLKRGGDVDSPVDFDRVRAFRAVFDAASSDALSG